MDHQNHSYPWTVGVWYGSVKVKCLFMVRIYIIATCKEFVYTVQYGIIEHTSQLSSLYVSGGIYVGVVSLIYDSRLLTLRVWLLVIFASVMNIFF